MMEKQFIQMMERCKSAIMQRDRQLAEIQPKADAYDVLVQVVHGLSPPTGGYAEENIVGILNKEIERMTANLVKPEAGSNG